MWMEQKRIYLYIYTDIFYRTNKKIYSSYAPYTSATKSKTSVLEQESQSKHDSTVDHCECELQIHGMENVAQVS